jgi:hypothetical protein
MSSVESFTGAVIVLSVEVIDGDRILQVDDSNDEI